MEKNVTKPARDAGFEVRDLYADDALRSKVLQACKRSNFIYFSGLGHGNATTFTGQRVEPIFWKGDQETKAISKDKHFNFLSCVFGKDGAKWMHQVGGAIGVHGYDETFTFLASTFPNSLATPFFDSHTTIDRKLLGGATHGEAHKACLQRFEYWIQHAPEACRRYLVWDKEHKVFWGNPNAKLPTLRPYVSSPIDEYKAVVYGKGAVARNLMAYIHCYYKGKIVLTCSFYKDEATLPENKEAGGKVLLMYHWSHFGAIIDLLRNEKPVYFGFIKSTKVGYISTRKEPVGEGEE